MKSWDSLRDPGQDRISCPFIKHYLKKDRKTIDPSARAWRETIDDPTTGLECDICGADLAICDSDTEILISRKKNHYMEACPSIPGKTVIVTNETTTVDSVTRVAALGMIKRVGKVDIIRDLREIPLSSRSLSANSDVYISLKENPPDLSPEVPCALSVVTDLQK